MTCEVRRCLSLLVVLDTGLAGLTWSASPPAGLLCHQRLLRFVFTPIIDRSPPEEHRQDLGRRNFFTAGWTDGWAEPEEGPDDAPGFGCDACSERFGSGKSA